MQLLTYGYAMSGCAGQAERPLQASWPQRPPGHCGSYRGETQPLMLIMMLLLAILKCQAPNVSGSFYLVIEQFML